MDFFFRPLRPCLSIFDATIILERIQIFLFFIHRTVFPVVTKCRSLFSGCDDGKHNGISTYPPLTRRASTFPHWCEGHTGARYSIYTNWANSWQLNHVMFIISFHSVCRFLASYCHGYYYRIGRRKGKKKLIDQTDTSLERKVGARTDPSHKFHLTKINSSSSSS